MNDDLKRSRSGVRCHNIYFEGELGEDFFFQVFRNGEYKGSISRKGMKAFFEGGWTADALRDIADQIDVVDRLIIEEAKEVGQ